MKAFLFCIVSIFLATSGQPARGQAALCVLLPVADGELSLTGDLMGWRTTRPASIQAVNAGVVNLYVAAPASWTTSPAGTPPTQFSASGTLSGVNVGNLLGGGGALSAVLSAIGTTTATISIAANAPAPFRAGPHVAQVTVTCSP